MCEVYLSLIMCLLLFTDAFRSLILFQLKTTYSDSSCCQNIDVMACMYYVQQPIINFMTWPQVKCRRRQDRHFAQT